MPKSKPERKFSRLQMLGVRPSPFLRNVFVTGCTSGVTIVGLVVTTKLLAQDLGAYDFGAYCLARQTVSTLMPFATVGMGTALARYVALGRARRDKDNYLAGSVLLVISSLVLTCLAGLTLRNALGGWIFGDPKYSFLLPAAFFMLVGFSSYSILCAFYRGAGEFNKANAWQIVVMGIGPVAVVCFFRGEGSLRYIVASMGLIAFSTSYVLFRRVWRAWRHSDLWRLRDRTRLLLAYGAPRVPGSLAFAGMLSIGPFMASHLGSIKEAGYLASGQSLFRVVEATVEAFGIVALPNIARIAAEAKTSFLRDRISDVVGLIVHMGLFASLHILLWADQIILLWLGQPYRDAIPVFRILAVALVPYLAFSLLRSIIDGVEERAVNTKNLYISGGATCLFLFLSAWAGLGVAGIATSTVLGLVVLGGLTVLHLWRKYRLEKQALRLKQSLILNLLLFGSALVFRYLVDGRLEGMLFGPAVIAVELVLFVLYCGALLRLKVRWALELVGRLGLPGGLGATGSRSSPVQ